MTTKVKIVTDSTAYLPPELVAHYDICIVPLQVLFGTTAYSEGVDITNEEFYEKLRTSKRLPTTSQPSSESFLQAYSELAEKGHPILSLHISGKLSGTIESALAAKRELETAHLEVVDSHLTAMALGMLVLAAGKAAEEGYSLEEIRNHVERLKKSVNLLFAVDTLEYLHKGGRIGGAMTFLGTILHVRPVLCLKEGRIEPVARVRSKSKAIAKLLDLMEQRVPEGSPVHVTLLHARAYEEALELERKVRERFRCQEVFFSELGPVLGTHVGPGSVGLAFYSEVGPCTTPLAQKWEPSALPVPGAGKVSRESLASQ